MPTASPLALPALLTLIPDGTAYFNREASRVLPAGITQLRLVQPATIGAHWQLLPGIPGGPRVRARADRVGYLRFTAPELIAHAFAAWPRGTARIYLELVPTSTGFALHFAGQVPACATLFAPLSMPTRQKPTPLRAGVAHPSAPLPKGWGCLEPVKNG